MLGSLALAQRHVTQHLSRAERMAHACDVSALPPLRRLVRTLLLQELARYRRAGRFPRNRDFRALTPYFIDAAGTRCAVAHLLEVSGEGALVQRIARERNHARVCELADEPRLRAWLQVAGLSLEEAAAIQPAYPAFAERAACVCGGEVNWTFIAPFGTLPADGVLVGTVVGGNDQQLLVRVDAAEGVTAPYAIDQEVMVAPTPGSSLPAIGKTVVVVVQQEPVEPGSDPAVPLVGAVLTDEGTYTCKSGKLTLGPLSQDQLISALRAERCKEQLAAYNTAWGESVSERERGLQNCAVPSGAPRDDVPTTLGILLALGSLLAARRRLGR
jgi:hypothetical protein